MLMADRDGRVWQANSGAERLFDYSKDELVGQGVNMLLPEAHRQGHQRLMAAFHEAPATRPMGVGRELFGRRKDGEEIPVEIGLNPLQVEGETFVVASILDISARRQADQRMQFVMRELTHRSKNLLAVIQAIARQAAQSSPNIEEFHRDFAERLGGLARSHDLLVVRDWQGAQIRDLVHSQLAFLGRAEVERVEIEGDSMMLAPEVAQNLGLALHELATNAVKHGSLASPGGKVRIVWRTEQDGNKQQRFRLTWQERGGAAVAPPERRGFGHLVLEDVVPSMLGGTGTLAFAPEGVTWTLDVTLRTILGEGRPTHAVQKVG
jgi:PAS domain S-box-containing protein